jgi:hypothetical protein
VPLRAHGTRSISFDTQCRVPVELQTRLARTTSYERDEHGTLDPHPTMIHAVAPLGHNKAILSIDHVIAGAMKRDVVPQKRGPSELDDNVQRVPYIFHMTSLVRAAEFLVRAIVQVNMLSRTHPKCG